VGLREGIFRRAGFAVEDESFGGSAHRVNALENDNAQVASLGEIAMLLAMSRDRKGFYWIGSQNEAPGNEGLVARGVTRIQDLRGKRVVLMTKTSVHLTVADLLASAGIDITDPAQVTVLHAADSNVVNLLERGDADAGAIWEPYYSMLRELPGATVLGEDTDTEIYRRFRTMTGPDVVCASRSWVDEDPARARRFFLAYFEAVRWCAEHPEELLEVVLARVGKTSSREAVAQALGRFTWLPLPQQRLALSEARLLGQARVVSELLVKMGMARRVPEAHHWTWPELHHADPAKEAAP
jgi:ABC-type nitrate/sulfonate/bicarbonate transport system substrate-binding protein